MSVTITLAGVEVALLADRAMFLPSVGALIVADVHWGKAASFRALGVPVPRGTTTSGLVRLSALLTQTRASQLIVLGDLFHAKSGKQPATLAALTAWRNSWPELRITLVRGNHDHRAGDPPPVLQIECVDAPLTLGPFALHHHPTADPAAYVLAGHIHPVVRLRGKGRAGLTLPCFAFGAHQGVLPAFGEFTGGAVINPAEFSRIYVAADGAVVSVTGDAPVPVI